MFTLNYTTHTNKVSSLWESIFNPISTPFFSTKNFTFLHEIEDMEFFLNNSEQFYFRDGILGLLLILSMCMNDLIPKGTQINISASLAPLVPLELKHFFRFYSINSSVNSNTKNNNHLVFYLSAISGFHDIKKFESSISNIQNEIRRIDIFKSPLQELSYHYLFDSQYDLTQFDFMVEKIHQILPNSQIFFHTRSSEINQLDIKNSLFIDTNHYHQFVSVDFLSYYYLFKVGNSTINLRDNSNLNEMKSEHLVKNLILKFYIYEGKSVIEKRHLDYLSTNYFPIMSNALKAKEYYPIELISIAAELKEKLNQPIV
jgi:hypothetical protein